MAPRARRTAVIAPRCPTTRAAPSRRSGPLGDRLGELDLARASARRRTCRRPRRAARPRRSRGGRGRGSTRPTTARSRGSGCPSVSTRYAPSARATKNGVAADRVERPHRRADAAGDHARAPRVELSRLRHGAGSRLLGGLGDLAGEVGEDEVGAGAPDREQVLAHAPRCRRSSRAAPPPSPSRTRRSRGTPRRARRTRLRTARSRRGTRARASPSPCRRPPRCRARSRRAPRARWPAPSGSRAGRRTAARTRPRRGTGRRARTRTSPRRRGSRSSVWPAASSAARIAPTWPSIIPRRRDDVGAGVGLRDRDARVALERRVVVDLAVGGEQPAVPVVGVLVEAVVGHQDERVADLVAQRCAARPGRRRRGRRRREPRASLCAGTPKRITPGTPRSASARTSLRRLSWVCCTTPGIETTGSGASMPSFTKSGATRSSTESRVSATGGAARGCGGAGAAGARGSSRDKATAIRAVDSAPRPSPSKCQLLGERACRSASTRPSIVCGSASASTRRPRSRAVCE